jgi:cell wall-associated NlpC family hydrolase
MATPNEYLWGGTVAPNYDCSGLMQAAFGSVGIQLPRDSYQQEAFTEPVAMDDLQRGDLLFFGPRRRKPPMWRSIWGRGGISTARGRIRGAMGLGLTRFGIWGTR